VDLTIDVKDGVPIYRQIANQIRYMAASGLLQPDEELPPIRVLAAQLRVTPNTVVKAYEELEGAGVISKRRGSGCFVSDGPSKLAEREKRRILEQRIDGLLAEARQLNYSKGDLLKLVHKRLALLDHLSGKAANGDES
jgi:GntR family transcriptional regulator